MEIELSFADRDLYRELYKQMFSSVQAKDVEGAAKARHELESLRLSRMKSRSSAITELTGVPDFVRKTLNQSQSDLEIVEASNCINAAFNFFAKVPRWEPYSTMEFLERVRCDFIQIDSRDQLLPGDLIGFWSRNGDEWIDRKIKMAEFSPKDPRFPFGIVFDHVAVFIGNNRLFHKPDPHKESRYQVNDWDDVVGFAQLVPGFELTFHRQKV